jgi:hypothetical protein
MLIRCSPVDNCLLLDTYFLSPVPDAALCRRDLDTTFPSYLSLALVPCPRILTMVPTTLLPPYLSAGCDEHVSPIAFYHLPLSDLRI